jgi:hypothetical protein
MKTTLRFRHRIISNWYGSLPADILNEEIFDLNVSLTNKEYVKLHEFMYKLVPHEFSNPRQH